MSTLFDWKEQRDAAMAQVERNAGEEFAARAREFAIMFLANGPAPTEDIADAASLDGIEPGKAWGPVMMGLAREGIIEHTGEYRPRRRGHGSPAKVWRLA